MIPVELPDTIASAAQESKLVRGMAFDDFIQTITQQLITFAIHLAAAILVFYVGKFLISKLYTGVHRVLERRKTDQSLATFVLSLVRITLYFLLIVVVIGILGIETSSFIALFASAGVAVGMALSGTLQNFAGGVLILLLKPYKVGEFIEAQGFTGTVQKIEIFNTVLTTGDNKTILIPNGPLSTGSINNYSRGSVRRVEWNIGISYDDDYERAMAKIRDFLRADSRVIKEGREIEVYIGELADSAVSLKVRAWTSSADYWGLYFDMNKKILLELPDDRIHFPFPQLDVHVVQS